MTARNSTEPATFASRRVCLLAAIVLLLCAAPVNAQNRIIVRTTLGLGGLQRLCLLQNCSVVGSLGDPLNQVFLVSSPLDPSVLLSLLQGIPGILDAEVDQLVSLLGGLNSVTTAPAALLDNTPFSYYNATVWRGYANQPAAQIVRASAAQSQFQVTGRGIVADIDTGVDPNHPALAGVLLAGYDFTRNQQGASELNDLSPVDFPSPPPPCPPATCPPAKVNQSSAAILDQSSAAILDTNLKYAAFGHGTMVLGVIHLVAPGASLLPLKAFHSDGTGFLSDILRAIYYAVQNHANVINMSFEFPANSPELAAALDSASQSALICAASAGNDGQKEIVYPAALQNAVMGVASTSDLDTRSSFSNYGNAIVWVAAPGEGIVSTYPFSTYAAGWGTSFSAPFVSGVSALLLNKQPATNESQAAAAVAHAVPVGPDMGNGRLDAVQALQGLSPQDFSLSTAPATASVNAGQSATYALTVTPGGGFHQTVTLGCSGFPAASTCVITPPTVTLDGTNPATATIVVQTTARAVVPPVISERIPVTPFAVGISLVLLVACVSGFLYVSLVLQDQGPCQHPARAGYVACLLAVLLSSYSCGGGYSSQTTYPAVGGPAVSSLTLNPSSVPGGNPSTGKIILSAPAPSGGTVVNLSSSNTSLATVPPSLTVPSGAGAAAFQITTTASASSAQVTISATTGGATLAAALTVTPQQAPGPVLTALVLNPASIVGGSPASGAVTLSAPAPSGGALVSLSSSNSSVVTVPASVTVPVGATSAAFSVSTAAVAAPTPVTVSASFAGVTQNASTTIVPAAPPGTPAGTYTLVITGTSGNLSHSATASLEVK